MLALGRICKICVGGVSVGFGLLRDMRHKFVVQARSLMTLPLGDAVVTGDIWTCDGTSVMWYPGGASQIFRVTRVLCCQKLGLLWLAGQ